MASTKKSASFDCKYAVSYTHLDVYKRQVYNKADKIANTDRVTVLINGETGTGKEHLASYIHKNSVRAKAPFIAINCSALNDELLTAELFGYKKGSYSFAYEDRKRCV